MGCVRFAMTVMTLSCRISLFLLLMAEGFASVQLPAQLL
ncbi:hypothetical protein WH7805_00925 [Synechococcus sp. WH 7805]|nr:hypothetical protein WH7805_00925 [Synechococcus sp. WH 7805]